MMHHDDKHDHAHDEHGSSDKHSNKCEMCSHDEHKDSKCACGCGM